MIDWASAGAHVEERAALLLAVRQAGVRDLSVMRAIEAVPREAFAPYRLRDLANRNMALPIGCGQIMSRPADLARRLEALAIGGGHRVLEVGSGSGYGAAVIAALAREVVTLERFETLAIEAARKLAALEVENALALFADGLAPPHDLGVFDRIIVQAAVTETPGALRDVLAPGGVMLFGRRAPAEGKRAPRERLIKLVCMKRGEYREIDLGPHRMGAAAQGQALAS